MDTEYMRSVWKAHPEETAHLCLTEVLSKQRFSVTNLHLVDRPHESGTDLLCTRDSLRLGIAVKKKPRQEDVAQLKALSTSKPLGRRLYVYLDDPSRSFGQAMRSCTNVGYVDRVRFHSMLLKNGSVNYVLLYFGAHRLFENLSAVFEMLYEKRTTRYQRQRPTDEEEQCLWSIKDDVVKLKAMAEYLMARWRPNLLQRLDYDAKEWTRHVATLHLDLDALNSIAGESLLASFREMSDDFPHLAARFWDLACCRTGWKVYTSTAIDLGKRSKAMVQEFTRNEWVVPTLKPSRRSSMYGPCRSVYSALWAVVESTFHIANDLEDGVDWLHEDMLSPIDRRS